MAPTPAQLLARQSLARQSAQIRRRILTTKEAKLRDELQEVQKELADLLPPAPPYDGS